MLLVHLSFDVAGNLFVLLVLLEGSGRNLDRRLNGAIVVHSIQHSSCANIRERPH